VPPLQPDNSLAPSTYKRFTAADPFAMGAPADAYKPRIALAQASTDDKVFSNAHGGMKLATGLLARLPHGCRL
jgi:hypothetical protein